MHSVLSSAFGIELKQRNMKMNINNLMVMTSSLHLKSQTAIFANLRLFRNCIELNILDGMAKSAAAAIAHSDVA